MRAKPMPRVPVKLTLTLREGEAALLALLEFRAYAQKNHPDMAKHLGPLLFQMAKAKNKLRRELREAYKKIGQPGF